MSCIQLFVCLSFFLFSFVLSYPEQPSRSLSIWPQGNTLHRTDLCGCSCCYISHHFWSFFTFHKPLILSRAKRSRCAFSWAWKLATQHDSPGGTVISGDIKGFLICSKQTLTRCPTRLSVQSAFILIQMHSLSETISSPGFSTAMLRTLNSHPVLFLFKHSGFNMDLKSICQTEIQRLSP